MTDAWFADYSSGSFLPEPAKTHEPLMGFGTAVPEADPQLVVGVVLTMLEARGVPVVLDHSLECAVEAAERLLRCFGVEASASWPVTR